MLTHFISFCSFTGASYIGRNQSSVPWRGQCTVGVFRCFNTPPALASDLSV